MKYTDLKTAVAASKRVTGKAPITLRNYRDSLWFLEQWQKKLKLAQTKVKKYRKQCKRYEKIFGKEDHGPKKKDVRSAEQPAL